MLCVPTISSPTAPIEDNDVAVFAFFVKGENMKPTLRFNSSCSFCYAK